MDAKNFLVKVYHYIDGELKMFLAEFDRIEDAIEHGIKAACHSYKVYDKDGCCCHDSKGTCGGTYA